MSDHNFIRFKVDFKVDVRIPTRNPKKTNWEAFKEDVKCQFEHLNNETIRCKEDLDSRV